jgi:hypothetical protein
LQSADGVTLPVHVHYVCDGCHMSPIIGVRYKSESEGFSNFDLCSSCKASGVHDDKGPFRAIGDVATGPASFTAGPGPASAPSPADIPALHHGIICDGCGVNPIAGPRFKSLSREDYDLCEECFQSGAYSEQMGESVKIPKPCGGTFLHRLLKKGQRMAKNMGLIPMKNGETDDSRVNVGARFVADVTIFDGTELAPGTKFTKIWKMRNNGQDAWPDSTHVVMVGGDCMTKCDIVPVGAVAPGDEIDIAVDMEAPDMPGRYASYWRLCLVTGRKFGHRIWCQIQVVDTLDDAKEDAAAADAAAARRDTMDAPAMTSSSPVDAVLAPAESNDAPTETKGNETVLEHEPAHHNPLLSDLVDAVVKITNREPDREFLRDVISALEDVLEAGLVETLTRSCPSNDPVSDLQNVPPFIVLAAVDTVRGIIMSTAPAGATQSEAVRAWVLTNADMLRQAQTAGTDLRSTIFQTMAQARMNSFAGHNGGFGAASGGPFGRPSPFAPPTGPSRPQSAPSPTAEAMSRGVSNASTTTDTIPLVSVSVSVNEGDFESSRSSSASGQDLEDDDEALYKEAMCGEDSESADSTRSDDKAEAGDDDASEAGSESPPAVVPALSDEQVVSALVAMGFPDRAVNLQVYHECDDSIEQAAAELAERTKYNADMATKIAMLLEMGFTDVVRSREMLEKHNGDVDAAIGELAG